MDIQVMSQAMVEQYPAYLPQLGPHAIISISSPQFSGATIPNHPECQGILRLKFHDVAPWDKESLSQIRAEGVEPVLFTPEHAKAIFEFVNAHPDIETLIVNCEMGISRSAAVAASISKIIHGDDEMFFKRYRPNPFIYTHMLRQFHGQNDQPQAAENTQVQPQQ